MKSLGMYGTSFPEPIYKEILSSLLFSTSILSLFVFEWVCVFVCREYNQVEAVSERTEGYKVVPMVRI